MNAKLNSQSENDDATNCDDVADDDRRHGEAASNSGAVVTNTPKTPRSTKDSSEKTNYWYEDRRYVLELLTFIVLTIYASLTLWQGCSASKSANAAKDAAETAKSALVEGQRAVVSADAFTIAREVGKGQGQVNALQFTIGWKNSGTTPTRHFESWSNWRIDSPDRKVDNTFDFTDKWMQTGNPVPHEHGVATSQKLITYYPMTVPRNLVEAVAKGQLVLIFWGRATYGDVFSKDIHTSEYCLTVVGFDGADPFDNRFAAGTTYPHFISCPNHNCHDEECQAN